MNFSLFLLILDQLVSCCRESVCRRRRTVTAVAWGHCTPWEIQISVCLGVPLSTLQQHLLINEWFYDFISQCDVQCINSSYLCKKCWSSSLLHYSQELTESQFPERDLSLVNDCIGMIIT